MFDAFVAYGATTLGRKMALNAVVVSRLAESAAMGTGLGVAMAFGARVFFMACGTALTVPLGMRTVKSLVPRHGMIVGLRDTMTSRAIFLFGVALGTVIEIHIRFLTVNVCPCLG
jgi:hypothetical protein